MALAAVTDQPITTPIKSKNTNTTAIIPSKATQDLLVDYFLKTTTSLNSNWNIRWQLLQRDRAYNREKDFAEVRQQNAKIQNQSGNTKPIEDIVIPVVQPQVESATADLSNIFLTGYPIFPVLSKGPLDPAALQMETLVGEHSVKFGWAADLQLAIRDGLKYNLMAVEVDWKRQKVWSLSTNPDDVNANAKATETYFEGNKIKHLPPYNLILDTRIANPTRMHIDGAFAGYTELQNMVTLKQLIADLGATSTMNAKEAFESGTAVYTTDSGSPNYYIPQVNRNALMTPASQGMNWFAWAGLENYEGIKYNEMYEVSTIYCRIIPSMFKMEVAAKNTIQIWKLIVVNRKVLIYAERQTNAHNYLGIIVGQPSEDGLAWQTKSYAENVIPFQNAATSLYKSGMESQRRKVYDRIFYDPSRINKTDIENPSAVARIAVKQVAYGSNLQEAIHIAPYRDDGVADILMMSKDIATMADKTNGQNPAQQGQFTKGNRSRAEFQSIMGSSGARVQMMAILLEYRFFQPIKEIIKLNILQFQPPTALFNRNTKSLVQINPVDIRTAALEFRLSDGLLPIAKMVNLDSLGEILQLTAQNPQAAAEYDIVGMMMHVLQLQGASWVQDYRRNPDQQTAYLQNMQATRGVTNAVGQPIAPQPQSSGGPAANPTTPSS